MVLSEGSLAIAAATALSTYRPVTVHVREEQEYTIDGQSGLAFIEVFKSGYEAATIPARTKLAEVVQDDIAPKDQHLISVGHIK